MSRNSILLVDDEAGIRQSLSAVLREEGFKVETANSGEACLSLLESQSYELILLDVWLPGIDGLETLEALKRKGVASEVVMISGHGTIETAVKATRLGAFDFVEKPLSIEKTLLVVKNALDHKHLQDENRTLRSELGARYRIVGNSVPMKALRQQLAIAAPTNGRVLIFGESGSGKELVAHALHHQSLRNSAPLVEVNCAAIPDELIESELFGHVKGAFTGATQSKIGKLEKADGGTLFLDEVGDMSLKTQAKVCGRSKSSALNRSAHPLQFRSMSASLRRPTRIWTRRWRRETSGRICFTGSTSFHSMCRPCENGWRMFRCLPSISFRNSPNSTDARPKKSHQKPWRS